MVNSEVRKIVCAVRSRPGGEETVRRAIELALEHDAHLTFFQVIDTRFLGPLTTRRTSRRAAHSELRDMAEFTLNLLCQQAEQKGVEKVDYLLREGDVREELLRIAAESGADLLVMGSPKRSPGTSHFDTSALDTLIAELERVG